MAKRKAKVPRPSCGYPGHAGSDWRLVGSERWECGVCHPPADGLEVETRSGEEPVRASAEAAKVAGSRRG